MYNPFELTLIIYKNSFAWNIFLAILKGFLYFCKIMNVSIIVIGTGNIIASNNIPYKLLIKKHGTKKRTNCHSNGSLYLHSHITAHNL